MLNFEDLDNVGRFTERQAALFFFGYGNETEAKSEIEAVQAMFQEISYAVKSGALVSERVTEQVRRTRREGIRAVDYYEPVVNTFLTRRALVEWVEATGKKKPAFLFPDSRPGAAQKMRPVTDSAAVDVPAIPLAGGVVVTLPYMTKALEAVLDVMRKEWSSYDQNRKPKQDHIAGEIDTRMGWKSQKDGRPSRNGLVCAVVIKPDE